MTFSKAEIDAATEAVWRLRSQSDPTSLGSEQIIRVALEAVEQMRELKREHEEASDLVRRVRAETGF